MVMEFNLQAGHWQCDIVRVREAALTDDVVKFMALRLQNLLVETQEVLKLAAYVGNQFDLATLAIVSEKSEIETATVLWKALEDGLLIPLNQIYKFFQKETEGSSGLVVKQRGLLIASLERCIQKPCWIRIS
jgi:predicted ATPase